MTEEKLEVANIIKDKIDKLDKEIYDLMDIMPPVRREFARKNRRGVFRKVKRTGVILKDEYIEIELSNEDVRALVDIRTSEQEALRQVLEEIK